MDCITGIRNQIYRSFRGGVEGKHTRSVGKARHTLEQSQAVILSLDRCKSISKVAITAGKLECLGDATVGCAQVVVTNVEDSLRSTSCTSGGVAELY